MTISTTLAEISYDGDGSTVTFPTVFKFLQNSHIRAMHVSAIGTVTTWTEGSEFTLSGSGNDSGGTLTVNISPVDFTPLVGERLVISRVVPETQETDYPESGAFPAASHENALDLLTMMVQQHSAEHDRSVKFPLGDGADAIGELPSQISRANKFFGFDTNGKPIAAAGTSANLGPVSSFVDTLLDDADADTARQTLGVTAGLRNKIINGNFDVWQRGTSIGGTPFSGHTADRWKLSTNGGSVSRGSFTAGQTDVPGEPEFYLTYGQTLDTGSPGLSQKIEDVRTFAGQQCVLSFYANASAAKSVPVSFTQNFGSGGSAAAGVSGGNVNIATAWQKFSVPVTLPSIAGKTIGTDSNLQIQLGFAGLGSFNINLATVQLEAGSQASSFEPRPKAVEMALCQRYFAKTFDLGVAPADNSNDFNGALGGYFLTSIVPNVIWQYPVAMRAAPTITLFNPRTGGTSGEWTNTSSDSAAARAVHMGTNLCRIDNSSTGAPSTSYWFIHATASAEL